MPARRKARKTMRTRQAAAHAATRAATPRMTLRERVLIRLLENDIPLDAQAMHDLDALEWMPKLRAKNRRELRARARIQAVRDTDALVGHPWRFRM